MKKLLTLLLALAMLVSLAVAEEAAAPALQKNLVILYTSDVHCGISQGWGYAGLYAIKESLSADNYVLLVDDGDAIQGEPIGTMTKGEALIDIMNTVGYDIAIPGNHEFDYGMERFLELTKKASFPYISVNFNKEGELVFRPYVASPPPRPRALPRPGISRMKMAITFTASCRMKTARLCTPPCRRLWTTPGPKARST